MEDASAAAALQLQLEDLRAMIEAKKGKGCEGNANDEDLAFEQHQAELELQYQCLQDLKLARSIARAVETDAETIRVAREEEERAVQDRRMAYTLGGLPQPHEPQRQNFAVLDTTDEDLTRLARLNTLTSGENKRKASDPAGPSSSKAARKGPGPFDGGDAHQQCVACREEKHAFDVMRAPCGDFYCRACIRDLFLAAITDDSLFPPRCCRRNIEFETARNFLEPVIQARFEMKAIEQSTPDRTYCSRPECSLFILHSAITAHVGTCTCGFQTCTVCKGKTHAGDCPPDIATQELLALAATNGWKQCFRCKQMVEHTFGCDHMT